MPKTLGVKTGFYTKLNVWGSLGLNFEYDGGPIIEIGGPIFLDKLRISECSTYFHEGSVLSPGQFWGPFEIFEGHILPSVKHNPIRFFSKAELAPIICRDQASP